VVFPLLPLLTHAAMISINLGRELFALLQSIFARVKFVKLFLLLLIPMNSPLEIREILAQGRRRTHFGSLNADWMLYLQRHKRSPRNPKE
jgi:hypothetical protein